MYCCHRCLRFVCTCPPTSKFRGSQAEHAMDALLDALGDARTQKQRQAFATALVDLIEALIYEKTRGPCAEDE